MRLRASSSFFFFNDTATTEIYTLSLHDALPIWFPASRLPWWAGIANWRRSPASWRNRRSEEHTSELQSQSNLVCRLLLEKKKKNKLPPSGLHTYTRASQRTGRRSSHDSHTRAAL